MKLIYGYFDNLKNHWAYIGKDCNSGKRDKDHNNPHYYNLQAINRAIQNNPERYDYYVLIELPDDFDGLDLGKLEEHFIEILGTYRYDHMEKSVFNFTKGGEGSKGRVVSEKTRKRISESNKGHIPWNKGKQNIYSEEVLKRMSDSKKGKIIPISTKEKMSKSQSNSGFFRVSKNLKKELKQGFVWKYQFYKNGKRKAIVAIDLFDLKRKVEDKNLPWRIVDSEKAKFTLNNL